MEIMAFFLQQALAFFVGIICSLFSSLSAFFSMVLNSGRLSGAFFRLFNPILSREGGVPLIHRGIAYYSRLPLLCC